MVSETTSIFNYMQSVPIATNVVSSNPVHARCTRCNINWEIFSV